MRSKHTHIPVYCIESYPEAQRHKSPFHLTRLESLVRDFANIDKTHAHDFYMVMFVKSGSGTHTIDFKTYFVGEHQLYFLTPGQVHSWVLEPGVTGFTFFFASSFFTARYPKRLFEYPFFHTNQQQPQLDARPQHHQLEILFEAAFREFEQPQSSQSEMMLAYLFLILETAARLYETSVPAEDRQHVNKVRQFEELINQYFLTEREVRQYAQRMGLTPNYLNALCQPLLGKTASQLIYDRIMVEAKRMLIYTDLSVKEIAFRTGFKDTSYFTRFFSKQEGVSPTRFREQEGRK